MSNLSRFMKQNKKTRENTTYAATRSLVDEKGNPLLWTIRPLTTAENERITDACTYDVPITGQPNMFRPKLNNAKYVAKLVCSSIVEPNLYDTELQDNYGVMTPEELLKEMVDNPAEFNALVEFIQSFNGFQQLEKEVEQAKN